MKTKIALSATGIAVTLMFVLSVSPASAEEPSPIAETVWPVEEERVEDLPGLVDAAVNMTEARITGEQPLSSYRVEQRNGTHVRLVLEKGQETAGELVLRDRSADTGDGLVQFRPSDLDRPWIHLVRDGEASVLRVLSPPDSLEVEPANREGSELVRLAIGFGDTVGFSTDALNRTTVKWDLLKPQPTEEGYPTHTDRSIRTLTDLPGCTRTDEGCAEGSRVQMSCHCAMMAGTAHPTVAEQLRERSDTDVRISGTTSGATMLVNADDEPVGFTLDATYLLRDDGVIDPALAHDRLVSFIEDEPGYEPIVDTEHTDLRLTLSRSSDRTVVTEASYEWTAPARETTENDTREAVAHVVMDATDGEILEATFRSGGVGEGENTLAAAPVSPAVAAASGLFFAAVLARAQRG